MGTPSADGKATGHGHCMSLQKRPQEGALGHSPVVPLPVGSSLNEQPPDLPWTLLVCTPRLLHSVDILPALLSSCDEPEHPQSAVTWDLRSLHLLPFMWQTQEPRPNIKTGPGRHEGP